MTAADIYAEYAERVAIRMFDGGQSEYRAAYAAAREIRSRYGVIPDEALDDLRRISEEYRRSLTNDGTTYY